jgi:hypothetical protein
MRLGQQDDGEHGNGGRIDVHISAKNKAGPLNPPFKRHSHAISSADRKQDDEIGGKPQVTQSQQGQRRMK